MSFLNKLVRRLHKAFDGRVEIVIDNDYLLLTGELQRWSDIVLAGTIAAHNNPYAGLINDIKCTGEKTTPMQKPRVEDNALELEEPDVLVIGGGVIGCAIARELSAYNLSVLLVEKEYDIAAQASGHNMGIIHPGVGIRKGTLRHKYCKLGNAMFDDICEQLGVDFKRFGQYFCLSNRIWTPFLYISLLYWRLKGHKGVKVINRDTLIELEPAIGQDMGVALFFPTSGTLCPFSLTIAYAENAIKNGVVISLNTVVQKMVVEEGQIKSVKTNRGTIRPKVVINAAGIFSEEVAALAGDRFFSIHPRKGTIVVLDKNYSSSLAQAAAKTLSRASAKAGRFKDSGIFSTASGNTLVGPYFAETMHKEDFSTDAYTVNEITKRESKVFPSLNKDQIIRCFSGVEAVSYEEDFIVRRGRQTSNIFHAAGIGIPGLTACPAISADIARMVLDLFGGRTVVGENPDFSPAQAAPVRTNMIDSQSHNTLIESNPDYGIIVCMCENISKGEILDAMRQGVRCDTVDGIKRRTRAGMGRCQGCSCTPLVMDIIAEEKRLPLQTVKKGGSKSEILFGNSKVLLKKKVSPTSVFKDSLKDSETEKMLRERAKEMLASTIEKRKDVTDDDR